ncbi:ABC transporter substrate-binding protein [Stygiolobus azoricus]|uniref:ABC transporter substrate-binding protein n=1 Tax=Stygiolobus azoricus TaxID=41675 RepID=A0A650CN70_9CREN|nr:ABC transporter substrate-binding protein [Stygiolobus azoricus]QGR19112.1 ABC transporter substrate-binding protein [Stygiolobus azoricus]
MRGLILIGIILVLIVISSILIYTQYYSKMGTHSKPIVTTPEKSLRIVSLAPSDTQILISLGLGKNIVGLDEYSFELLQDLNETSLIPSNVTMFSSISPPNISGILLLHPDIVVLEYGLDYQYIPDMEKAGLNLLVTNTDYALSLAQIEENILNIAQQFNKTQVGKEIVNWMNSHMINYTPSVNVTYLIWIEPNGEAYTAGGNVFINNLLVLAGGKNVFANESGYPLVTVSNILIANPQVIIAQSVYNYTYTIQLIEKYYSTTSAVRDGKVYVISGLAVDLIDEPSVLSVYGAVLFHDILIGKAPHYINTTWVKENLNVSLPVF